ncbi:MAG: molybdopterin molybdotransferase MoeA [Magnetococcales bacterium]|nr:molybdopterin molybdotransferase MoeA [Magnetococcales bacterium]
MLSFDEARNRVLAGIQPLGESRTVPVREALGRVLAWPAVAGLNVPNHDNSAMDGYGVRMADLDPEQPTTLEVVADLPAGERLTVPLGVGQAVRIMTGAPVPEGCDCVVMQEVATREGRQVTIPSGQRPGQHIRAAGEDIRAGEAILPAGRRLTPPDLGLLTSLGFARIQVRRRPKVAVLSTGNEVVEAGGALLPGMVYDSNRTALLTALAGLGVKTVDLGLAGDRREAIETALARGAREADAIITTGGVSEGDYDLVKEILQQRGEVHFWKVAMKPGKPQAYGRLGGALFFGLPGNPVSGLAVFLLMVRPALLRLMGATDEPVRVLELPFRGEFSKKHDRLDFVRGVVHWQGAESWVETTGPQGSGILTSLSRANAFIVLPPGPRKLRDGDRVTVRLIDWD